MEELIKMLNSIYPLGEELKSHLVAKLQRRHLIEGEYLLKAGRICENVYFVKKGSLRNFYLDYKRKKEINTWFMSQGDVVYAIRSFLDQIPSTESIQALQDTTVYYISYQELQDTFRDHITFNIHGRILTEKYYKLSVEREEMMRMPDPVDRFKYLVEHFPDLLLKDIPDYHLASFVRMSTVTMWKVQQKIIKPIQ